MDNAEIKKIVIDLDGVEIGMSFEQAKKLAKILDEMFGDKRPETVYYPIYYREYTPYWNYPTGPYYSANTGGTICYCSDSNTAKITL